LGVGLEPTRRERQGDDLDLDAVVELEVERQAGDAAGHARVYVDHLRRRRDLGVLVLLDISGSSGEADATGRSVHAHQREAAGALLDALEGLGDRVAAYGFQSRGRAAVHFARVKAFDDPLDARAYARLGGLEPGSFTRLGAAVRHATHILETKAGTPRRLLVVLSDGFAYDHGYEGAYAEADARRALTEAREQGIGCLCLSLGATTEPAALRRVFEPSAFAAASRFEELGPSLGLLFRRALAMSDLRRRLARRGIHAA
jgi:nitric oxide reductase activation protein